MARDLHIEEIRSDPGKIVPASTSETAFIDYFARGPMNQAVRVTSYPEFETFFGGLHAWSEASYGVRQFFLNGGRSAWLVRVPAGDPQTAALSLGVGSLTAMAANPGEWGNNLQVSVAAGADGFDLSVRDAGNVDEEFAGLNMNPASLRYAIRVVNESSRLIRLNDEGSGELPSGGEGWQSLEGGNDGDPSDAASFADALRGGLDALTQSRVDLICMPSAADLGAYTAAVYSDAISYCREAGIFLIVDLPKSIVGVEDLDAWMAENESLRNENAAVYFPRTLVAGPLGNGDLRNAACSGSVLGLYARTDAARGVWRAPSGTNATLLGVTLAARLTDQENAALSSLGVNGLRTFPNTGPVSWGSRTLEGADGLASEWKYVPVRRLAIFLEHSLDEGSSWIMFEPNGEELWSKVRLSFEDFLHDLFLQGAFRGATPRDAYFVKCDRETTSQADIDAGIVNIVVGFAPLKPAEFVVIRMQRTTGEVAA